MTHANRNQRILYIFRQLHAVINWRPLFRRIVPRRHCSVIDTARGGRFSSHFTQCKLHNGIKAVEEIKNIQASFRCRKKNHIRAFSLLNVPG